LNVVRRGYQVGGAPWTRTGLQVRKGEKIDFETSGEWCINSNWCSDADGARYAESGTPLLPGYKVGSLIGWLPDNTFHIGKQGTVIAPANGELHLAMNDVIGAYDDNRNTILVTVSVSYVSKFEVQANRPYDTGYTVQADETLNYVSSGRWCIMKDVCGGPDGFRDVIPGDHLQLRGYKKGTLLANVIGGYFAIGSGRSITFPQSGRLYLLINDNYNGEGDNSGTVTVEFWR
jgi:hypothetical protein